MKVSRPKLRMALSLVLVVASPAWAQTPPQEPFKPTVGQPGKDVVWVPTPPELVEKMLDMAKVTPQDFVIDLGSGDGRNIIAAAKRGARALGVEFNPDMVELSKRQAAAEGVGDKAMFVQGDMYEADISKATVLALFLLPHNLTKLTPKFLALRPGTRIVGNTFAPEGWTADESETISGDCMSWCTSLLWFVPAQVEGMWRLPQGELSLKQEFQMISGTLTSGTTAAQITEGRLRGDQISFVAGGASYSGRVSADTIEGTVKTGSSNGNWSATRARGTNGGPLVQQMPALKRLNTPQAVVDEHLDAINKCDWQRLMAQYPPEVQFFLPGGQVVKGREQVGELFRSFVRPVKEGGLCGLKFETENSFTVGDTVNVQWRATAGFLAVPYRGADAYVTKDGLMWAQVTTFDGGQIKMK